MSPTRGRWWTGDGVYIVAGLIAYGVLAICCFAPFGLLDRNELPRGGLGDPAQMAWFLAYTPHALSQGLNLFHTNLIDYPTGVNLADNTSVPFLGALASPITAIAGPVASFNVLLRLALCASAGAAFLCLRRWCQSLGACFVGGLCFGFGPYLIGQSQYNAHVNLAFVPFVPLLAWCLDELLVTQRYRAAPVGVLLGFGALAQLLIAPEVLSDSALVAGAVVVVLALCYHRDIAGRWRHALGGIATGAAILGAGGAYPVVEMLVGTGHLSGPVDGVAHLQAFRNDVTEVILPTTRQFLAPASVAKLLHLPTRDVNEAGGYLSFPLLIADLTALIAYRRVQLLRLLGFVALVGLVLSFGSRLSVNGHVTGVALPEALLAHLGVLDSTVPDRFALVTAFAAAAMFAVAIDRALAATRRRSGRPRVVAAAGLCAVVVIVLAALAPRLPISETPLLFPRSLPAAVASATPRGTAVLTYPYPSPPFNEMMLVQADEAFAYRLLGGYATVRGPRGIGLSWPVLLPPDAIQEFLARAEAGPRSHYPAPPATISSDAVCTYLRRYSVSTVAVWTGAVNAGSVTALFTNALGRPVLVGQVLDVFRVRPGSSGAGGPLC